MESVKEIVQLADAEIWMPILDLATAVRRQNILTQVTQTLMKKGVDYGSIPGTNSKPVLLKPGAERLCAVYGLSPEIQEEESTEDWMGNDHNGEPFFYYRYKCRLTKNGVLLGEGIGSCNSWESKYRYRTQERKCPQCGVAAIIRGKEEFGGGWLCFARKGGCGAKFKQGDPAIEQQNVGRIANADIADQVNTIQKMAHKRALVAAVLIATNASEFFTQDIEDLEIIDISAEQPTNNFREMIEAFARLKRQFGEERESLYYGILARHGVKHSNQFESIEKARAAYRELKELIDQDFPTAQPQTM